MEIAIKLQENQGELPMMLVQMIKVEHPTDLENEPFIIEPIIPQSQTRKYSKNYLAVKKWRQNNKLKLAEYRKKHWKNKFNLTRKQYKSVTTIAQQVEIPCSHCLGLIPHQNL